MDAGHIELELVLVSYFDATSEDGKVHVHNKFFCAQHLKSGTWRGLFESVSNARILQIGVTKFIGFGCGGVSAEGGLRGL